MENLDEDLVQNVVMDEELVQNIVMDGEPVQNVVMDEELFQNVVMDAKIDPEVVVNLSIFNIGAWIILQPSNRKLLEECIEENEPWLLSIRIPSRHSFFMIRYLERHFVCDDPNVKEIEATS